MSSWNWDLAWAWQNSEWLKQEHKNFALNHAVKYIRFFTQIKITTFQYSMNLIYMLFICQFHNSHKKLMDCTLPKAFLLIYFQNEYKSHQLFLTNRRLTLFWDWNIKHETETWNQNVKMKLEIKLDIETRNWNLKMKLKLEIET